MADSTKTNLNNYHRNHYGRFGPGSSAWAVDTIYAGRLGYVSAALAVIGVTDKWQGVQSLPVDTGDEMHLAWPTPHTMHPSSPIRVRFGMFTANADDSVPITLTVDYLGNGDEAADGATSVLESIPTYTGVANRVGFTKWALVPGYKSTYDSLFMKAVIGTVGNADGGKIWCVQIAYKPLTK
jgi:hypothetical protein